MQLFDEIPLTDVVQVQNNDPIYDHYNRCNRDNDATIRNMLVNWFVEYPEFQRDELKTRFKKAFYDCFFELFLYKMFMSLGFEIEIHPPLPNSLKRPDFLIKKNGLRIYIEAKTVHGKSHAEEAHERFVKQVYKKLNAIRIKGHILHFEEFDIKTKEQPSTSTLIDVIEREASLIISKGSVDKDKIMYQSDDFHLVASLVPLKNNPNGYPRNPIGIHPVELFYDGCEEHIRKAIVGKARKYGSLDYPYIVCIDVLSDHVSGEEDIESAIWGSLAMRFIEGSEAPGIMTHMDNGVFHSKGKPILRKVSGVLVTQVFPHNIESAKYYLYQHPFTNNSLDFTQLGLEYWFLSDNGYLQKVVGNSIYEILENNKSLISIL